MIVSILRAVLFAAFVYPALLLVQFGVVAVARIYGTAIVAVFIMLTGNELARVIREYRTARARGRHPHL